eukprot:TRINITY_DN51338_c0_g1_i1.p1 TRINITY_DN51338_c0_g1~~TRINITY_DN51338_c0_g1_i1.p1  ORF type:complete len:268 (+),score=45.16 TRINITY_DN51338_c0_g1_i1:151-954(+)
MPIHPPVAPSDRRGEFSRTFTHGEGPYATAYRATDRKEYLARLYHPETHPDTSVLRDHRRAGRDPHHTNRHWEELDAYRARHAAEPNMYQTEQERMIADHIRQMGPSVCLETEALAARQERFRAEDHARRKKREELEDAMNCRDLAAREQALDIRLQQAVREEDHLRSLRDASNTQTIVDGQEYEAALRHSLLRAPAMRSLRTISSVETRKQELTGYPSLTRMASFPDQQRTRAPESTLLETPTAVPKTRQYTLDDIRQAAGFGPMV